MGYANAWKKDQNLLENPLNQTIPKSKCPYFVKFGTFMSQNLDFWHEKLTKITHFQQIRVCWILQISKKQS